MTPPPRATTMVPRSARAASMASSRASRWGKSLVFSPAGSTVGQAIEASGLRAKYPEIDPAKNKLGIYAKLAKVDTALRDRDRVEIYRPLIADPKEVRKQRAAEGKVMKKGGGEAE